MDISVVGAGYVGLAQAACLLMQGHRVVLIDHDPARLAALQAGQLQFQEPGIAPIIARSVATGQLQLSSNLLDAPRCATTHIVAVGTPFDGGFVDLSPIYQVITTLAAAIQQPGHLIIGKSTVPVGTAQQLRQQLPVHIGLAWVPEFLREGSALQDTMHPHRIVLGVSDAHYTQGTMASSSTPTNMLQQTDWVVQRCQELYAAQIAAACPVMITNYATAELIKLGANAYLSTRLSFINALLAAGRGFGVQAPQVVAGIGADPRIGTHYLQPGLGFGGSCLPKDLQLLTQSLEHAPRTFFQAVDQLNQQLPGWYADLLAQLVPAGARVTVWGATFKPETTDLRHSPALQLIHSLQQRGLEVRVHDPAAVSLDAATVGAPLFGDIAQASAQAAAIIVATAWPEYQQMDPHLVRSWVAVPRLIDARLALPAARWQAAGWQYWC